jgi:predicted esterase
VHVFIGFSNGGGFLNRLYQNCQFTKGDVVISIGNGLHKWHKPQYEGDLKNCGKLYLLIGKADQHNKDNAQYAYQTLKVRGADVTLHEYEGEHEMNRNLPKLDELIGRP